MTLFLSRDLYLKDLHALKTEATEVRKLMKEVQEAKQNLQKVQTELKVLLEASQEAVVRMDTQFEIVENYVVKPT